AIYTNCSFLPTILTNLYYMRFTSFFFFINTATTFIYTLSLHDALPIFHTGMYQDLPRLRRYCCAPQARSSPTRACDALPDSVNRDRKSTRLNSSHVSISYAVFCLKKKKRMTPSSPPPRST